MRRFIRNLVAVAAAGCIVIGASTAWAHEPYEITVNARLSETGLVLQLLVAEKTAALMCGGDSTARRPGPGAGGATSALQNAARLTSLQACGRDLFKIRSGQRDPLNPLRVDARITVENDVELTITFPPPPSGPLRLEAIFLDRLRDPTYGAYVTVTGPGTFLGQKLLRATLRVMTVAVPGTLARRIASP